MILLKRGGGGGTVLPKEDKTVTCVLVVYRKQLLISPELIYLCKVFWGTSIRGGLHPRGLKSEGAYIRGDLYPRELISEGAFLTEIKKCTSKQAIIVLIKIRLTFTGF